MAAELPVPGDVLMQEIRDDGEAEPPTSGSGLFVSEDSEAERPTSRDGSILSEGNVGDDEESDDEESDDDDPPRKQPRRARKLVEEPSQKTIAPRTPTSTAATPRATPNTTPRVFPPWVNTPYHVLLSVFDYVAAPIRDTSSRREDVFEAVASLRSAARACKAFTEPALANLYKSPPFYHQWRYTKGPYTSLSQFIDTLNLTGKTMLPYRRIVKILRIEVGSTLTQRHGENFMNLQNVIPHLVNLAQLEFYHESDHSHR